MAHPSVAMAESPRRGATAGGSAAYNPALAAQMLFYFHSPLNLPGANSV